MVKKIFFILFLFSFFLPSPTFAEILKVPTQDEFQEIVKQPTHRIKIPGLEYGKVTTAESGAFTYLYVPYIGEFLSVIYRYFVVTAGVIAVIVIIVGGMEWTASAGNSSTIESAKKRITNAILGLVLTTGSYVLLYTISPELVSFRSLKIKYVQGIDMSEFNERVTEEQNPSALSPMQIIQGSGETPIEGKDGTKITYGFNNIPYYSQFDSRWGALRYGEQEHCTSFTKSACGPTSIAMILKFLGKDVNPTHVAKLAVKTNARNCNDGTNSANTDFQEILKSTYSVNIEKFTKPEEALKILKEKKEPLLISSASEGYGINGKFKKYDGHFMVVTGVDTIMLGGKKTEVIRINDPGNRPGSGITYMTMDQFNKKDRFLYFTKNGTPPPMIEEVPMIIVPAGSRNQQ